MAPLEAETAGAVIRALKMQNAQKAEDLMGVLAICKRNGSGAGKPHATKLNKGDETLWTVMIFTQLEIESKQQVSLRCKPCAASSTAQTVSTM